MNTKTPNLPRHALFVAMSHPDGYTDTVSARACTVRTIQNGFATIELREGNLLVTRSVKVDSLASTPELAGQKLASVLAALIARPPSLALEENAKAEATKEEPQQTSFLRPGIGGRESITHGAKV